MKFVLLPSATEQLINGDSDIIDPAVCLFDPNKDYPLKLPDGSSTTCRVTLEDGRLMAETDPADVDLHASLEMHGVHQVTVAMFAHVREVHAEKKRNPWIM